MVMLAGSTGLRRSEFVALTWRDIDLELMQVNVHRSCVRNRFGDTKTEASRKPVPLHASVVKCLGVWREASLYRSEEDFMFPSIRLRGKQPISPDTVLKKIIRPALIRAGIKDKAIGWHSFRHSLATNLRAAGVDLKTAQELLRHANSRITLDVYTRAISATKREANNRVMDSRLFNQGTAILRSWQLWRESFDGRKQANEYCRIIGGCLTNLIECLFSQTWKEQGAYLKAQLSVHVEPESVTLRSLGQNRQSLSEQVH